MFISGSQFDFMPKMVISVDTIDGEIEKEENKHSYDFLGYEKKVNKVIEII